MCSLSSLVLRAEQAIDLRSICVHAMPLKATKKRPRRVRSSVSGVTALQAPTEYSVSTCHGDAKLNARLMDLHDAGWICQAPILFRDRKGLEDGIWKVIAWRFV